MRKASILASNTLEVGDLREKEAIIRQVLVITDGCSNVGSDPIDAARKAYQQNISVNVVGVVDKGDMGKQGQEEAMSIAEAGGGMCRIVRPVELSATAQMLTHQTMQLTLQQVVSQELQQVMGKTPDELPPAERTKVMQVVDKLEEEITLELVVAIDVSASMKEKMMTVREAIRDLSLSLEARSGASHVGVIAFPGLGEDLVRTVQPFSSHVDVQALEGVFIARGGTPTGPAIDYAVSLFKNRKAQDWDDDFPAVRWTGDTAEA